jgi:phenylacetate-CoA ligase
MKKFVIKAINENKAIANIYNYTFGWKKRKHFNNSLNQFIEFDRLSLKELTEQNKLLLQNILTHAENTTTFYRELFEKNAIDPKNIEDFKRIPILTKSLIKKNVDQLISSKFKKSNLNKRFTGGSTGEPMEFFSDAYGPYKDLAQHAFLYQKLGVEINSKMVSIVARMLDNQLLNAHQYWIEFPIKDLLYGDFLLSSKYLNNNTASIYIEKLNEIKPSLIRGYPSAINVLANYVLNNPETVCLNFKPLSILLTSEICTEEQKINIENAFNCRVHFEYGHKEISVFCYTTPFHEEYWSSPAYCYVEVLDENDKDTEIGKVGRIVATGFNNLGMPFIRYETGDLAELSFRSGGFVKLKRILGREQDYLLDLDGNKKYLIGTVYQKPLEAFNHILIWQFRQNTPGLVDLLIVPKASFSKKNELELSKTLEMFEGFKFNFLYMEDIPKTKLGKHLFVKREM